LISSLFAPLSAAQNRDAAAQVLPGPYQKWLDEDVRYIITVEERTDFAKLTSNQQRDRFIEDFWERRNPHRGSAENTFKEEHYRRLAYTNQHFAAGVVIPDVGKDVVFEFVDTCRCGVYRLREDRTQKRPSSPRDKNQPVPLKTAPRRGLAAIA
jgi:hypothetical protein